AAPGFPVVVSETSQGKYSRMPIRALPGQDDRMRRLLPIRQSGPAGRNICASVHPSERRESPVASRAEPRLSLNLFDEVASHKVRCQKAVPVEFARAVSQGRREWIHKLCKARFRHDIDEQEPGLTPQLLVLPVPHLFDGVG